MALASFNCLRGRPFQIWDLEAKRIGPEGPAKGQAGSPLVGRRMQRARGELAIYVRAKNDSDTVS
jgi:hypothetical protein